MFNLKAESEIIKNWKTTDYEPKVSICCIAYNHAEFIEKALNSFLNQETEFPFDIVIGEDCSTDITRSIIEGYSERYPNIIKLITSDHNVGMNKNFFRTINACQGKYIAICEGDDSWNDKTKLQQQYTFLENNPNYALCYSSANIMNENGEALGAKFSASYRDCTKNELLFARIQVLTMTSFIRSELLHQLPAEMGNVLNLDRFLFSYLGQFGKGKFLSTIRPSTYNIHSGGVWSLLDNEKKNTSAMNSYYWMGVYFQRVGLTSAALFYYLKSAKVPLSKIDKNPIFILKSITDLVLKRLKKWT